MLITDDSVILEQVERILHSDELRGAKVLRRLLKFLADKSVCGEADELKEYIVAIDGLGKPASYDPRHNSAVRIQVGRLRQKLADYYRTEGLDDPIIIDVPKGRFKLVYEQRPLPATPPVDAVAALPPAPLAPPIDHDTEMPERGGLSAIPFATLLWVAVAVMAGLGLGSWLKSSSAQATRIASIAGWTPELEDLWGPFITSKRPLIVVIEDPLFVRLQSSTGVYYYTDRSINDWENIAKSPALAALRSGLQDPAMQPSDYFTAFAEANASFLIGKFLGSRQQNFSMLRSSELSWQQLADNNVLLVGRQNVFFDDRLQAMPVELQFLPVFEGIHNLHPQPGEPALFSDQYSSESSKDGVAYALVTHLPGPLASDDMESFISSRSAGYMGAVKAFTDPDFAAMLVRKLRQASGGRMPRYYQVLLRIKFKAEVPTETSCVLIRELR